MKKQTIDGLEIYSMRIKRKINWDMIFKLIALSFVLFMMYMLIDTWYMVITNYKIFF